MLNGRCPECGARYCGWALNSPRNQMCENCGAGLEIIDTRGAIFTGYSPFTAQESKFEFPFYEFQKKAHNEK